MDPEILIVEGEGALTRALLKIRNSLNLTLHVATDALHAISLLQLHSYSALVIDEEVGYVDGWALLRYLEENGLRLDTIVFLRRKNPPVSISSSPPRDECHLASCPRL